MSASDQELARPGTSCPVTTSNAPAHFAPPRSPRTDRPGPATASPRPPAKRRRTDLEGGDADAEHDRHPCHVAGRPEDPAAASFPALAHPTALLHQLLNVFVVCTWKDRVVLEDSLDRLLLEDRSIVLARHGGLVVGDFGLAPLSSRIDGLAAAHPEWNLLPLRSMVLRLSGARAVVIEDSPALRKRIVAYLHGEQLPLVPHPDSITELVLLLSLSPRPVDSPHVAVHAIDVVAPPPSSEAGSPSDAGSPSESHSARSPPSGPSPPSSSSAAPALPVVDLTGLDESDDDVSGPAAGASLRDDDPATCEAMIGLFGQHVFDRLTTPVPSADGSVPTLPTFEHPDLKRGVRLWQVVGAVRALKLVHDGYRATIFADQLGLGKTTLTLFTFWLARGIRAAVHIYHHNRHEADLRGTPPRLWCPLSPDLFDKGDLPSSLRFGVLCPCVSSLTTEYASLLPRGPSAVFAPPSLLNQWVDEAEKLFGSSCLFPRSRVNRDVDARNWAGPMSVYCSHGERSPLPGFRDGAHLRAVLLKEEGGGAQRKKAHAAYQGRSDDYLFGHGLTLPAIDERVSPNLGVLQGRFILLLPCTSALVSHLGPLFCVTDRRKNRLLLNFGFIAQDELHKLKDPESKFSRFLQHLFFNAASTCAACPAFLPITATPISAGLHDLRLPYTINYLYRQPGAASGSRPGSFARPFNEVSSRGLSSLSGLEATDVQTPMVSRVATNTFRGVAYAAMPPAHTNYYHCPAPAEAREDVMRGLRPIDARALEQFRAMKKEWKESGGDLATKPSLQRVYDKLGSGTSGEASDEGVPSMLYYRVLCTIPAIAQHPDVSPNFVCRRFRASDVGKLISRASGPSEAIELLQATSWAHFVLPFIRPPRCPRLEKLVEIVDRAMADSSPLPGTDLVVPKKVVVLANNPGVAAAFALGFAKARPGIGLSLLLSEIPSDRRQPFLEPFSRRFEVESAEESDVPDPRVLFSTKGLVGTGLNLSRANYIVLLEQDSVYTNDSQAIARIIRVDQRLPCQVSILLDKDSAYERSIMESRSRRRDLGARFLPGRVDSAPASGPAAGPSS
jgi:hypothetical protein